MAINLTAAAIKKLPKIADGGEATVYKLNDKEVVKIFLPKTRIKDKEAKVKNLLAMSLQIPGLVTARDIVETNGKFVGYVMPLIDGANPLHDFTKARFVKTEQLTNLDALQIIAAIGVSLHDLHNRHIVVGDVSDNNFMATVSNPHQTFLIDYDSWGVGNLPPDAFTETFVPPESYNGSKHMLLDAKTDNFGYAILAFNVLTRLHPFNGTYSKDTKMSVTDRIKNRLSVLGPAKNDIVINKAIPSWQWMSPDLQDGFLSVFEKGVRDSVAPLIDDQLKHSKKCPIHGVYYYDRFADCPLCSGQAKIIVAPVKVAVTGKGPQLKLVFESPDVRLMLDKNSYVAADGSIVYRQNNRRLSIRSGERGMFAVNGKYAINIGRHNVSIKDANGKEACNIPRAFGSAITLNGINLFYVDVNDVVCQLTMTAIGFSDGAIQQSCNPLLAANDAGQPFIVARYEDRLMVTYDGHDIELPYRDKITEYAIKYDEKTATWLFIIELRNGKHRTIVFGKNGIEYDNDTVRYHAAPLSNLCYYGGTVYDPGNGEIVGTNLAKNQSKSFACPVVDADSVLEFDGRGFDITTDTKLYRFG